MEELKLIEGTAWINTMDGDGVKVGMWPLVYALIACKKKLSDNQLRVVKAALDRETLHRSKLIQSQTKV